MSKEIDQIVEDAQKGFEDLQKQQAALEEMLSDPALNENMKKLNAELPEEELSEIKGLVEEFERNLENSFKKDEMKISTKFSFSEQKADEDQQHRKRPAKIKTQKI